MQTTELGYSYAELFEMALSLEIVEDGDEIELEDLKELLNTFAFEDC